MCPSQSLFHNEMHEIDLYTLLLLMGVSSLSCVCDGARIKPLQEENAQNVADSCSNSIPRVDIFLRISGNLESGRVTLVS